MLANAAAAVKADKKAALVMFNNGEVSFKYRRLISVLLRSQRWPVRGCYSLIDGYGCQSPQGPHLKCIRPRTIRSGAEAGRRGQRGHLYVSKARRGQDAGSESNIHHEGRGSRLRCWVLQINTRAGSLAVRRLLYPPRSGRIRWVGREDRRRRVAQGQAKAKAQGRYSGRPAKTLRRTRVSHACSTPACHGHKYKIHSSAVARRSQRSPSECARRKPPRRPALSSLPFDVGEREPPMEAECGHWIEMRAPSR